ncbi:uncharacterized protein N7483_005209 [Penicillium malachiteum]|uniref:uncharacterized protein n=1 Tax=Penicillium malachiteum TaxID=1324776 RepID=UPI002548B4A5|nr:uncharacterized protein N7483_005209 [Penicillium malachiteum]KAJ5730701.1 hypothetical protein N7483_005209 [Penicillium malachiteum]
MGASGPSAPQEAAPAYEELFEQRPSNRATGYSQIPATDNVDEDIEHHSHGHHHHGTTTTDSTLLRQRDAELHFHCETCDLRQERREKRLSHEKVCKIVAGTFVIIIFCLCAFGFGLAGFISRGKGESHKRDIQDIRVWSD